MGREVMRVALDFDWPMKERWKGYLNPHHKKCPHCDNGYTASRRAFERIMSLFNLAAEESLPEKRPEGFVPKEYKPFEQQPDLYPPCPGTPPSMYYPHPYLYEIGINDPGTEFHEITTGLSKFVDRGEAKHVHSPDKVDTIAVELAILKAAGVGEKWGWCKHCDGEGIDPTVKEAYDAWEKEEPPAGDGWQMWETTSEGSPISPVFKTPEELARWLADTGASSFGNQTATYEQWLGMIQQGWCPSMVVTRATGPVSGVEYIGSKPDEKDEA